MEYVDDSSRQQINVKSDVRLALERAISTGNVTSQSLLPAQAEIYMLMEKDKYVGHERMNVLVVLLSPLFFCGSIPGRWLYLMC